MFLIIRMGACPLVIENEKRVSSALTTKIRIAASEPLCARSVLLHGALITLICHFCSSHLLLLSVIFARHTYCSYLLFDRHTYYSYLSFCSSLIALICRFARHTYYSYLSLLIALIFVTLIALICCFDRHTYYSYL